MKYFIACQWGDSDWRVLDVMVSVGHSAGQWKWVVGQCQTVMRKRGTVLDSDNKCGTVLDSTNERDVDTMAL